MNKRKSSNSNLPPVPQERLADISDAPNALMESITLAEQLAQSSDPNAVRIGKRIEGFLNPIMNSLTDACERLAALPAPPFTDTQTSQ